MTNFEKESKPEDMQGISETKVEMDAFEVSGEIFPFRADDPEARKRALTDAREYIKSQHEN